MPMPGTKAQEIIEEAQVSSEGVKEGSPIYIFQRLARRRRDSSRGEKKTAEGGETEKGSQKRTSECGKWMVRRTA